MKVLKFIILFFSILLISCNSNRKLSAVSDNIIQKEVNYIPYYLKIDQAQQLYKKGEREKCFLMLDSLFNHYKPINSLFIDELEMYCELAIEYNKKDKLEKVVDILISDYGYNIAAYKDERWVKIKNNITFSQEELIEKYSFYRKNLNLNLRDSIISIFKKDQAIRKTNNVKKIDSVDRIHEPYHIHFIKKYGYPYFKIVGGNDINDPIEPAFMSVMLKHISLKGALELQPILLNEVKKGNCPPLFYAGMLDLHKVVLKEETPFEYFGTYSNIKPTDTTATNNAREKIGLPRKRF